MSTKPKLGDLARDIITGFKGIVVCHTKWVTSCDTYGLSPQSLKDGKPINSQHFDVDRIEVVERDALKLVGAKPIKESRKTGGPSTLDSHPVR